MNAKTRCSWCTNSDIEMRYHDEEWGVPVHDDRTLFEFLTLEGAQAGLSWVTVLKKREHYCKVFDHFDIATVAGYEQDKIEALLQDPGIIRNRLKVESTVSNARAALAMQQQHGSLDAYLWQFTEGRQVVNHWQTISEVPVSTEVSDRMSKTLKKDGFRFVGTTICYAFMQAVGMVNDHTTDCFRHQDCCL